MTGRVIAIVGPSGVGKDSVMAGLKGTLPNATLVRRVITRPKDAGGEEYDGVTEQEFKDLVANGAFCIHWRAHELAYGIPRTVQYQLGLGKDCLVNFSRTALSHAAHIFPNFVVLNITAAPETLARRLAGRGRETKDQIAQRLSEAAKSLPIGMDIRHLSNDGPLTETIARATLMLIPSEPQGLVPGHTGPSTKAEIEDQV
ncbi:MAG: phosphonate metabolism protein/1,5-bisphosphokinase (PRPP-forming) PhnN [Pseudomonadota bacterium]